MLYERSSITASLAKHLKFQKLVTFIDAPWVNSYTSKQKNLKSGEYTFWKRDIQGVHERINITATFAEHIKFRE